MATASYDGYTLADVQAAIGAGQPAAFDAADAAFLAAATQLRQVHTSIPTEVKGVTTGDSGAWTGPAATAFVGFSGKVSTTIGQEAAPLLACATVTDKAKSALITAQSDLKSYLTQVQQYRQQAVAAGTQPDQQQIDAGAREILTTLAAAYRDAVAALQTNHDGQDGTQTNPRPGDNTGHGGPAPVGTGPAGNGSGVDAGGPGNGGPGNGGPGNGGPGNGGPGNGGPGNGVTPAIGAPTGGPGVTPHNAFLMDRSGAPAPGITPLGNGASGVGSAPGFDPSLLGNRHANLVDVGLGAQVPAVGTTTGGADPSSMLTGFTGPLPPAAPPVVAVPPAAGPLGTGPAGMLLGGGIAGGGIVGGSALTSAGPVRSTAAAPVAEVGEPIGAGSGRGMFPPYLGGAAGAGSQESRVTWLEGDEEWSEEALGGTIGRPAPSLSPEPSPASSPAQD